MNEAKFLLEDEIKFYKGKKVKTIASYEVKNKKWVLIENKKQNKLHIVREEELKDEQNC